MTKRIYISLLLIGFANLLFGQEVVLSARHQRKLDRMEESAEKEITALRFYRIDSVRLAKIEAGKQTGDSLVQAQKEMAISQIKGKLDSVPQLQEGKDRLNSVGNTAQGYKDQLESLKEDSLQSLTAKTKDRLQQELQSTEQGQGLIPQITKANEIKTLIQQDSTGAILEAGKDRAIEELKNSKEGQEIMGTAAPILEELQQLKEDSLAGITRKALEVAKSKALEREELAGVKSTLDNYDSELNALDGIVTEWDSTTVDSLTEVGVERAGAIIESEAERRVQEMGLLDELSGESQFTEAIAGPSGALNEAMNTGISAIQDIDALELQAKQELAKQATDYVMNNGNSLNTAYDRMAKLKKKYISVPNSNDLSTAVKRTSLEGHRLGERLIVGSDVQWLKKEPFSMDAWGKLGYKLNRDFWIGVGGNYRISLADTPSEKIELADKAYGYSGFVNYKFWKGFLAIAEFDRKRVSTYDRQTEVFSSSWTKALMIGIGKEYQVHPAIIGNVAILYNPMYDKWPSPYPRRFTAKMGFRLSEGALMKRKIKPLKDK